jgi:hypothetical protein
MFHEPVLCCIAKDEELYIIEWITYHLKIGFYKIFIYDNNDDFTKLPNCLKILDPELRKKIIIIHFPGKYKQMNAYNHFLKNYSNNWKWVAIIDCDEFIVIKNSNYIPIKKILIKCCKEGSLGLHWKLFGNNHKDIYEDIPVTSRFIKCDKILNPHIKSISVCKDISHFNNPHYPILYNHKKQKDYLGRIITGPLQYNGLDNDTICVNHYFCKTKKEWDIKRERGLADKPGKRDESEYEPHNKNDVEDFFACNFYNNYI